MVKFVAWLDMCGTKSLIDDPSSAVDCKELFREYTGHVKTVTAGQTLQIFGVNDGCFLRTENLNELCTATQRLCREWFDKRSGSINSLPLLRGGIADSSLDEVETDSQEVWWLFGRGFRRAFENEQLLRGGRLFVDESIGQDHVLPPRSFKWKDLSEWGSPHLNRQPFELLWPWESGFPCRVAQRLAQCISLYNQALEYQGKHATDPGTPTNVYRQYEETLKLMIRSVGLCAHEAPSHVPMFQAKIEPFLDYEPTHRRFTWGLAFVTLEALFRLDRQLAETHISNVLNFLETDPDRRLRDFCSHLTKPSFQEFKAWLCEHSAKVADLVHLEEGR